MGELWEAVTPDHLRDGDRAALRALGNARGRAVLAYCESLCAPSQAVAAAADAFTLFRVAVITSKRPHEIEPEELLLSCTRRAAAKRTGSADRLARRSTLAPRPSVRRLPALLDARADARLECEDEHGPGQHLLCIRCRETERRQGAAEAAYYDAPPIAPVGEAARAIQRGLKQAGRAKKRQTRAVPARDRVVSRAPAARPQAAAASSASAPKPPLPRVLRSHAVRPVVRPKFLSGADAPAPGAVSAAATVPATPARGRRPPAADVRSRGLALGGALFTAALVVLVIVTAGGGSSPQANAARASAPAKTTLAPAAAGSARGSPPVPTGGLAPLGPASGIRLAHQVPAPSAAAGAVADVRSPRHRVHRAAAHTVRRAAPPSSARPRPAVPHPHFQPTAPPPPAPRIPPAGNPSPRSQTVIRVPGIPSGGQPVIRVPATPSGGQPDITVPGIKPAPATGGQPVIHVAAPPSG